MTELTGTLAGLGLPAIARFLGGLQKTGCLRIQQADVHGEVFFASGRITGASLGSRHGLPALDALFQALPGAAFNFDVSSPLMGEPTISLSPEDLQAHFDQLAAQAGDGTGRLPTLEVVPSLVAAGDSPGEEDPLPLDRGTLQTLLAVDGQRTVGEIVARRGSIDALWQIGHLLDVGLVQRSTTASADTVASVAVTAAATMPASPRPIPVEVEAEESTNRCPKLGFEDDPSNALDRPTRLHRCFAAATPLPLSIEQQRELCLSSEFGTCPRLTMAAGTPVGRDRSTPRSIGGYRRPEAPRPAADGDHPRIVRLPIAHTRSTDRDAVADRHAVGGSEPTRFRSVGDPSRDGAPAQPTPLRSRQRLDRSTGPVLQDTALEPPETPQAEGRLSRSKPIRDVLALDNLSQRLPLRIPVWLIVGGLIVLVIGAMIAFMLWSPTIGNPFADDSVDTSNLPNASAAAAGTPIAQLTGLRSTVVPGAAAAARATLAAAAAVPQPTDTLATNPVTAATASDTSPGNATAATVATPAGVTTPAPRQTPAPPAVVQPTALPGVSGSATVLDERFGNNDRNWPSSPLGTALVFGGSYRLAPLKAGQFVAIDAPIPSPLKDVTVSATFHKVSGPPGGGYGIVIRDQAAVPQNGTSQDGHYYVLEVGDKGEVGMWRRDGDHWSDLLSWQHADAVNPGTGINIITARAIGTTLSLAINGTQVATRADATFPNGNVGLFVGGDGNLVAVDQFTVQTP